MAKYIISVLTIVIILLPSYSRAEPENNKNDVYNNIVNSDHILLEDAYSQISSIEERDNETDSLYQELTALMACQGLYIQAQDESSTGKTYTANIEFYLKKGQPYCSIDYTNYMGTIQDAPVEKTLEEGYLFISRPTGTLFGNTQNFGVYLGDEKLRIQWADGSCDYTLTKSTGDATEVEDKTPPFTETDIYTEIIATLDTMFNNMDYSCSYDEEKREFTVYVVLKTGFRDTLLSHIAELEGQWEEILENIAPITEKLSTVVDLATKDGMLDTSRAKFTIVFVDELKKAGAYYPQGILCIISDGTVLYDVVEDVAQAKGNASPNSIPPTTGEKNALRKAKDYLEITAFSYKGLIDQLEYEGFSQSEATYGADNCGANWYAQAAKKAASYLELTSFSYDGLVEQLEYEGFTHEQAVYGVNQNW